MFTKPHFRQVFAINVNPGDKIYSRLTNYAEPIDKVIHRRGRIVMVSGCMETVANPLTKVWKETKPRCLR